MAHYEVMVLPWAVDDVRETYLYLFERDERLAEDFKQCVRVAMLCLNSRSLGV